MDIIVDHPKLGVQTFPSKTIGDILQIKAGSAVWVSTYNDDPQMICENITKMYGQDVEFMSGYTNYRLVREGGVWKIMQALSDDEKFVQRKMQSIRERERIERAERRWDINYSTHKVLDDGGKF